MQQRVSKLVQVSQDFPGQAADALEVWPPLLPCLPPPAPAAHWHWLNGRPARSSI